MARALLRFATFAVATSFCTFAHAGPQCLVRLHDVLGEDAAAWQRAVHTVQRNVASEPGDCSTVDVRVDGGGASIELRTLDGRAAERRVQTPGEMGPLVRALLIGFDTPIAPAPDVSSPLTAPETPSAPEPVAEPQVPIPDAVIEPPKPKVHPEVFAAVGAGMELQANDGASGVGQALVGISLRAWQIGAFAKWELEHHQDSDPHVHHSNLDAAGGGAMFGRRQTAGPVTLVFGTSFGLYSVDQERGSHRDQIPHIEDSVLDPRAGLYLGALFPTTGRIRTRAQLDGEVAFLNHSAGSEFPNVPQWGMGLSVGVDFGLTP